MPDPRESLGRLVHDVRRSCGEGLDRPFIPAPWEERTGPQQELDMRIGAAVASAERERAERAEAKLAEVRRTVATFIAHYGHSTAASFKVAQDLAEAVRQVLDREPLETQGRSDEKEAGRGR